MNVVYTQEITVHNPPKALTDAVDLVIQMMNCALSGFLGSERWNSVKPMYSEVKIIHRRQADVNVYSDDHAVLYSFTLEEQDDSHSWECTTDVVKLFATVTANIASTF